MIIFKEKRIQVTETLFVFYHIRTIVVNGLSRVLLLHIPHAHKNHLNCLTVTISL